MCFIKGHRDKSVLLEHSTHVIMQKYCMIDFDEGSGLRGLTLPERFDCVPVWFLLGGAPEKNIFRFTIMGTKNDVHIFFDSALDDLPLYCNNLQDFVYLFLYAHRLDGRSAIE